MLADLIPQMNMNSSITYICHHSFKNILVRADLFKDHLIQSDHLDSIVVHILLLMALLLAHNTINGKSVSLQFPSGQSIKFDYIPLYLLIELKHTQH